MNYEKERFRMVDEQILCRGVRDERVIAAMRKVPRHEFLPEAIRGMAYQDSALPLGEGQTMSQPYMVARMTEFLGLQGTERVLEIGTGSGYQAAVLSELCGKVYSVERIKLLAERARLNLDRLGYRSVAIKVYDGTYGWKEMSPFNAIMVTAGAPDVPAPLVDQLKEGGRMVIPVGDRYGQVLLTIVKGPSGTVKERSIPCTFVPLVGNHGWKE
ncbi:MAG TPA: protein-L-isoaspartate(D-aspartate) O-methyltransferase [Nitrospirota bacterium]|nr:protein-L-isoaspartate(D-aspartate) O-methyltransferase [Nitrospirota bacterium]